MREIIWRQLDLLPAADGAGIVAGIVAAPGVVAGRERHLEWWQRTAAGDDAAEGYSRIRLNLDPESIDLYDYLDMRPPRTSGCPTWSPPCSRWIPGTRLHRLPGPGDGEFTAITAIGADSGWLLAAARA